MRRTRLAATSILAASALLAGAGAATAADQTVEATVVDSMDLVLSNAAPTASLSVGANTFAAGTLTVKTNSTTATVTVSFQKAKMTEWDSTAGTYVATSPATLTNDLTLTALSGTTSVGTASSSTGGTLLTADLLGVGDSVFDLSFSQPVLSTDKVATYRNVVTYSAATL